MKLGVVIELIIDIAKKISHGDRGRRWIELYQQVAQGGFHQDLWLWNIEIGAINLLVFKARKNCRSASPVDGTRDCFTGCGATFGNR